ncbi:MAG: hypothetical protein ACKPCM_13745 [Pseudanabaena sp.]
METEKIETNLEQYLSQHQDGEEFILRILQFNPLTFYVRPYNKQAIALPPQPRLPHQSINQHNRHIST